MGAQSVIFEIIHESLMNKDTELSVSALCEIAGVSRSGYYRWVSAEKEDTAADAEIQPVLSVPQGKSVSTDGKGTANQQCRCKSPESGV